MPSRLKNIKPCIWKKYLLVTYNAKEGNSQQTKKKNQNKSMSAPSRPLLFSHGSEIKKI